MDKISELRALLPALENKELTYTDTLEDCLLMTVKGADRGDFDACLAHFAQEGFRTAVGTRPVLGTDNLSAMLCDKDALVNVFFDSVSEKISLTIEPNRHAPADFSVFDRENLTEGAITPLLIQIGLDGYLADTSPIYVAGVTNGIGTHDTIRNGNGRVSCGMSYLYRLSDGRFAVLDGGGGISENGIDMNAEHASRIFRTMEKYNRQEFGGAGGAIEIAAWYITHPHTDHIGAFFAFVNTYLPEQATLSRVICNLPNVDTQSNGDGTSFFHSEKMNNYANILAKLRERGTAVWKAHVGQIYYIGNLSLEILLTADLLADRYAEIINYRSANLTNAFSVMTQATLWSKGARHTMLWTGDSPYVSIETVNALWGSALKSDFVQVMHHGYTDPELKHNYPALDRFYGDVTKRSALPEGAFYADQYPEDGDYGFVRAKYILIPVCLRVGRDFVDGEPGDGLNIISNVRQNPFPPEADTSDHTHQNPNHHLQEEARAQGGDAFIARNCLTLFSFDGATVRAPSNPYDESDPMMDWTVIGR